MTGGLSPSPSPVGRGAVGGLVAGAGGCTATGIVRSVTPFVPLAAQVFPDSTPRNASRRLRHFIATDPELLARMREAGYDTRRTWLSPRQYYILQEYL